MARDPVLQEVLNNLKSQHYNFTDDWIDGCAEFFRSENPNASTAALQRFVLDQWLLADLREMETLCLPPNLVNETKIMLPGKYALQVEAMLDISVSCYSQHQKLLNITLNEGDELPRYKEAYKEPKGNRMWQLTLCDGTQEVKGLEHEVIKLLSQPLIPGSKVLIIGPVLCRRGKLLLTESNIKLLGGEIDSMIIPNAYENILCKKLGLPLNPDPYNENLALPDANVAPLPNAQPARVLCNNNLPPLFPPPPPDEHWDQDEPQYGDRDPDPSLSDDDLIDAEVDAQLSALEQQHAPTGTEERLQDGFEQQYHDNSDIMDLSEDEDLLQSFDYEAIERQAIEQASSVQRNPQNAFENRRNSANETRPSVNVGHRAVQNPPENRPTCNQAFQNQPTIHQSSNQSFENLPVVNQAFQNQPMIRQSSKQVPQSPPTARQSSNQTFQSPPTARQSSNQTFQTLPTSRQSSNQTFQSPPTARQSSNQTFQTLPTARQSSNQTFQSPPTARQSSNQTFQSPPTARQSSNQTFQTLPTSRQSSNQTFQSPPTARQSSNQTFQTLPTARQSSNQTFQSPPTARQSSNQTFQTLPTARQSSNQTFQSPPTARQSSNQTFQSPPTARQSSNQTFQTLPTARQSSNQTFQSPPTARQSSNQTFQSPPTARQSSNQTFQSPPTVHQSSTKAVQNQSKVRQPIPSSQSAKKQTKLTSFLTSSKSGDSPPSRRISSMSVSSPKVTGGPSGVLRPGTGGAMLCGPDDETDAAPAPVTSGSPYVYLAQLARCPPSSRVVHTVKAFVMTVVAKVSINREGWHLVAKICDGSAIVDAVFSSNVVESLIGYSHQEVKAMRSEISRNPNLKEKLVKAFEKAQNTLVDLNCLMRVEYLGDGSPPCVIELIDVTEKHFAALQKRLDGVKRPS